MLPVELTDAAAADPVFAGAPRSFPALQWHGDTFDLPDGATLLASSPAYRNQAFVYRSAYALQFHIEVPPELAREWGEVPAYAESLESALGPGALPGFLADVEASAAATVPLARSPLRALARARGRCARAGGRVESRYGSEHQKRIRTGREGARRAPRPGGLRAAAGVRRAGADLRRVGARGGRPGPGGVVGEAGRGARLVRAAGTPCSTSPRRPSTSGSRAAS